MTTIERFQIARKRFEAIGERCAARQAYINRLKLELGAPVPVGSWQHAEDQGVLFSAWTIRTPQFRDYPLFPRASNSNIEGRADLSAISVAVE